SPRPRPPSAQWSTWWCAARRSPGRWRRCPSRRIAIIAIDSIGECRMSEIRYTKEHEWVKVDGDTATVGISPYAQEQLGDVVFVELPEVGKKVEKGKEMAVVESVKSASEVYAPI